MNILVGMQWSNSLRQLCEGSTKLLIVFMRMIFFLLKLKYH